MTADCDVLVVGYGPVGQALTILLAQRGYRVTVRERRPGPYPRPRAVHYDDEIARVFAAAGIGDEVAAISQPSGEYDWQNAEGRTLLHFDWGAAGLSGWPGPNKFAPPPPGGRGGGRRGPSRSPWSRCGGGGRRPA